MTKYQEYARKNYTPMEVINEMWHPEIQAECRVMNDEAIELRRAREEKARAEAALMGEIEVAAETKNLDFLRQGYVIIDAAFGGTIAKKKPMSKMEIESLMSGMTPDQKDKAKKDLDGMEKRLFSVKGFPELDNINSETTRLRERFKNLGLPFASGQTIMKVETLKKFVALKEEIKVTRKALVDALVAAWPLATSKETVDSQFWDERDYKPAEAIAALFTFKTTILGFVSEELLREQVSEASLKAEQADMVNALAEVKREGIALMRETIADLVSGLAESLTPGEDGSKKKFHASSVTKIMEYLETFQDRNLWGDNALQAEVEKLKGMVEGINPDKLSAGSKGDESLRERVRKQMETAKASLSKLLVNVGDRSISLE